MAEQSSLRVLIADDERPARAKLRRFLEEDSGISTIYEASDGDTALEVIREADPDLVFLDIQMPGRTGLEVLEAIPEERLPYVIFVTAYDEHAIRAFEIGAVDYLLKPFERERFGRSLARARQTASGNEARQDLQRLVQLLRASGVRQPSDRLMVESDGRRLLLAIGEVDRLESDRNYVRIHAGGMVHRARGTLEDFELRLDAHRFVRIARGTIVNLDRVRKLESLGRGDQMVTLRDGTRIRVSRRYVHRLEGRLV